MRANPWRAIVRGASGKSRFVKGIDRFSRRRRERYVDARGCITSPEIQKAGFPARPKPHAELPLETPS